MYHNGRPITPSGFRTLTTSNQVFAPPNDAQASILLGPNSIFIHSKDFSERNFNENLIFRYPKKIWNLYDSFHSHLNLILSLTGTCLSLQNLTGKQSVKKLGWAASRTPSHCSNSQTGCLATTFLDTCNENISTSITKTGLHCHCKPRKATHFHAAFWAILFRIRVANVSIYYNGNDKLKRSVFEAEYPNRMHKTYPRRVRL